MSNNKMQNEFEMFIESKQKDFLFKVLLVNDKEILVSIKAMDLKSAIRDVAAKYPTNVSIELGTLVRAFSRVA